MHEAIGEPREGLRLPQTTGNSQWNYLELLAYGFARRDADPAAAYASSSEVSRSQQKNSGNRWAESHCGVLSRWVFANGDPAGLLDYLTTGEVALSLTPATSPPAQSAVQLSTAYLDRLGRPNPQQPSANCRYRVTSTVRPGSHTAINPLRGFSARALRSTRAAPVTRQ